MTRAISLLLATLALALAGTPVRAEDATTPAFKEVDSIEARVQGCVTCHGNAGQGTRDGYYPRIAGKPAAYLFNQLVAFRDGQRKYPPMNYLVATLPDAYLREIAQHFAKERPSFEPQAPVQVDAATLERGRVLATQGDSRVNVPACTACHGAALAGMEPGIPGLAGLRSNYIVGQLTRWRVGDRHAAAPDCMARVATRLSDPDIAAVASWLARQSPKDAAPEPANLQRMPYACGSQEAR